MLYPAIFILTASASFLLALAVRRLALLFKIQDVPAVSRKQHAGPVPLLGGLALYLSFFGVIAAFFYLKILPANLVSPFKWLFFSSAIIMLGGFFDDKYILPPKVQILFPLLAIILALLGGVRIHLITNPAGGILPLGLAASLVVSFFWLLTITYTTKILDGLDGLVSGITALGALTIFLFTTLTDFKEPGISYIALVLAGSFAGFLILNFYPAKIFLGEGGSLFSGFILGGLAIITGAKIAVTLMVLALPLIDLAAVIIKRLIKKQSIFKGDRLHLHYLLVDRGWKPRNVVFLFWALSAVLGLAAVFLPSWEKVFALATVGAIFFLIDIFYFKKA